MAKNPVIVRMLADIEAFRARTGIDRTNFGLAATGDGHFIARVERGKQPRLDTIDKVYRYIRQHRRRNPA